MIVTRFKYPLEKNYIKKVDLMIDRCESKKSKKDSVLLFEGGEGEGKTTYSVATGYYVSEQTGRSFSDKNLYFDTEKLLNYAKENKNKILVWDEPALQALSTDRNKIITNLYRLLMTARKKRHFIMINMSKFFKFNEYIVVDRPVGMVHVYSRKNIHAGRFIFIKRKNLEHLYRDWRFKKQRNYWKYHSKIVKGTFPDVLNPDYKNNVLSEFDMEEYERRKDKAIGSIGVTTQLMKPTEEKLIRLQYAIYKMPKITQDEKAKLVGETRSTISKWGRYLKKYPDIVHTPEKEGVYGCEK